uniref:Proteophosphoglycan ppg4 n=1 Tax=Rhodotorula toruloides TaxID=5286 RepID=A0A0K3CC81_RHOTO
MLSMLAPLTTLLLALPQVAAHPLASSKRSDNGSLLALWNGNPGPVYYSTSSHSCDKKSLAAVGTSFPLVLDVVSYPYSSNLSSQTVLLSVGSYKKNPGQVPKALEAILWTFLALLGFGTLLYTCTICAKHRRLNRAARQPAAPSQPTQPAAQPASQSAPTVNPFDQESAYCESIRTATSFSSTAPLNQTEGRSWRLFGR